VATFFIVVLVRFISRIALVASADLALTTSTPQIDQRGRGGLPSGKAWQWCDHSTDSSTPDHDKEGRRSSRVRIGRETGICATSLLTNILLTCEHFSSLKCLEKGFP
jgi:hypothetical protein